MISLDGLSIDDAQTSNLVPESQSSSSAESVPIQNAPAVVWETLPGWNGEAGTHAPSRENYAPGHPAGPASDITKQLIKLKDTLEYPVQSGIRTDKRHSVLTNHFEIELDRNAKFWEYRIVGIPESEKKSTRRRIVTTIIEQVPWLKANQNCFATDYVETIIAWKNLHALIKTPELSKDQWTLIDIKDRNITMHLNINFAGLVDLDAFHSYVSSTHPDPGAYNPEPIKNALNIIFTKAFEQSGHGFSLNAHKFFIATAYVDLKTPKDRKPPLRAYRGYEYRVKTGMGKILLNVNTANSAFWVPWFVSDILLGGLNTFGDDIYALRNLQVYITYERGCASGAKKSCLNAQYNRVKKIRDFGRPVSQQTLKLAIKDVDGNTTSSKVVTVADYLEKTYKTKLLYKDLPAVDLSPSGEPSWYAPEQLLLLPNQIWAKIIPDAVAKSFHETACLNPRSNRARIEHEGLAQISRTLKGKTTTVNQRTITAPLTICPFIKFNPTMLQIPAAQVANPDIRYRQEQQAIIGKAGNFNLAKRQFVIGAGKPVTWKMLHARGLKDGVLPQFRVNFEQQLKATGVSPKATVLGPPIPLPNPSEDTLRRVLHSILKNEDGSGVPDIVVLMLRSKEQAAYSTFKYLADNIFGFNTICVTEQNFGVWKGDSHMLQYAANVSMKANLKFRGTNHSTMLVRNKLKNTLVIGADLTGPGSGAVDECPSIAAVVGSTDEYGGRFRGILNKQANVDWVENLGASVLTLLRAWCKSHNRLPDGILYYRDGVSKGQFDQVKNIEVEAIKTMWDEYTKTVKKPQILNLTTVICTKRHSTRLYPVSASDAMMKNENCRPGMLVDTHITDPYYSDFYLQSQNAIKGTARPCHYFVLTNGMDFSMPELQDLTHNLNHTYVRATLGVSYAAPAYYADRLCERGRCYLREWYNPDRNARRKWMERKRVHQDAVRAERDNQRKNQPKRERGHKKSEQEIREDKEDADMVAARLRSEVLVEIEKRWSPAPVGDKVRMDQLAETMYWM